MSMIVKQNWKNLPAEFYPVFYSFLDPISARTLAGVERRANEAFLKVLPQLIGCHFRCRPSSDLSPNNQHLALTISSSPNALSVLMVDSTIQLNRPGTQLFK